MKGTTRLSLLYYGGQLEGEYVNLIWLSLLTVNFKGGEMFKVPLIVWEGNTRSGCLER
jgi:hypothetical protein